jgi:hypothetical protein
MRRRDFIKIALASITGRSLIMNALAENMNERKTTVALVKTDNFTLFSSEHYQFR